MSPLKNISIPHRNNSDIWAQAEKLRAATWNGNLPVNVEVIAEKGFDLTFLPIDGLRRIVGAEAYISGDLKELHYETNSSPVRLRFSIAHELGHAVLHSSEIKALRPSSMADWKNAIQSIPGEVWGRAEYQAREFAGRLLVPRELLLQAILSMKEKIDSAKQAVPDIEPDSIYEFMAPIICRKFLVSDQVIIARLKSENIDILNL